MFVYSSSRLRNHTSYFHQDPTRIDFTLQYTSANFFAFKLPFLIISLLNLMSVTEVDIRISIITIKREEGGGVEGTGEKFWTS